MILLLPLVLTAVVVRVLAGWLTGRGVSAARAWASWPAAAAAGMAVVYVCTGVTHFIEPQRSGLVAIVPSVLPAPELLVTVTGLAEFAIAVGLVVPRTRRWAALASVVLLLALFPANVVAAAGVDHPAAPSTPLVPRALLQAVFVACSAAVLVRRPALTRPAAEGVLPPVGSTRR